MPVDYYSKLGMRPVVNGWGSSTVLGGSTPAPEVVQAMDQANRRHVEMGELLQRSGDYIADVLGAEAAYVASGAAAALALSTAACMAGTAPDKIGRLPDTTGMKGEILIQKRQRYRYDRCYTIPGGKLVEAGDADGCTPQQLVGVLAALDAWFSMDHEDRVLGYRARMSSIEDGLAGVPHVATKIVDTGSYWQVELHVSLDKEQLGKTAGDVAEELDRGDPRVWVAFYGDDTIVVKVNSLGEGEEHIIAERMRAVLTS